MMTLWTLLPPVVDQVLAKRAPDPDDVKPGWLGFLVFLLLLLAVVLLWLSLRKHLGRVNFDENENENEHRNQNHNPVPGDPPQNPRRAAQ